MTPRGHFALVLHAHLPFVRHPEYPHFLEEHWLFEAITDCYLPLVRVLREAVERGSRFRSSLSLSPTLLSMLADPLLQQRYLAYLERLVRLCEQEIARPRNDPPHRSLARFYQRRLLRTRDFYLDVLRGDLIAAWAELAQAGTLELMTTVATHGYLPLLRSEPAAVRAQLRVARDFFRDVFGCVPNGLWLPECGYYPGLEREVAAAGFGFFILDVHGLQGAVPPPPMGVYAAVSSEGVAVFGRDPDSAREVWSRETGYPGHPLYREYHRDLGFESDPGDLAVFLPPGVDAAPTGIKYYRVTGGPGPKALYDPGVALGQAERDAQRFVARRRRLLLRLPQDRLRPILVAPYDAELFGHWWFEGPAFLAAVIRHLDAASGLAAVTLSEHLESCGTVAEARPAASSWGERGYNAAWLRPDTGWVYVQLHQAAAEMKDLVRRYNPGFGDDRTSRLLRQAARSLLLAQSSDWTFHMGGGGGAAYAESRLREQLARFRFLTGALRGDASVEGRLAALERMDNLFPRLDLAHFV
ncbi:MAG: 1,4-alpha-glucan branching protein domain-containing protein [Pseudomonadota bacterium]|nr:1,4-alpha-glucan branching protein domain-containing protein [Pseudomonadota bacterium]